MHKLSWKHHTLIQSLISRGPLKDVEIHAIFEGITGKSPVDINMFNDYLLAINKELAFVQMELRGFRNQYDEKVYYGVANNIADEQSKLGSKYSVPQIVFYRGIIDAIVNNNGGGYVSSIDVLNIHLETQYSSSALSQSESSGDRVDVPPAIRNFSLSQKEQTLNELVNDHWLCFVEDGNVGVGVRSFLDLKSWFHSSDVPLCEMCNEAGIKADICENEGCGVKIHRYCIKKKLSGRGNSVCPRCGTLWVYQMTKEEVQEEEDENRRQQVPVTRSKKPRVSGLKK